MSSSVASGFFARWIVASTTSPMLCGGMLVAMPTAMPPVPFTSRFGKRAGKTSGSVLLSSKLGPKSTHSLSMSARSSIAILESFASVYR